MVRGLGTGFISTSELTVPQVGSSSGRVSEQPFAALPDGCVRKGGRNPAGPGAREELGAAVLGGSAPRCCPAAGASRCRGSPSSALLGSRQLSLDQN